MKLCHCELDSNLQFTVLVSVIMEALFEETSKGTG